MMKTALLFSDVHYPAFDCRAWRAMLAAIPVIKPHWIVALGDVLDMHAISSHFRCQQRPVRLIDELRGAHHLFEAVAERAPKGTQLIWLAGNHEHRLEKTLSGPQLALHGSIDLPDLVGATSAGWSFVPYRQPHKVLDLYLAHDLDRAGKHAGSQALSDLVANVATGHNHRLGYSAERTIGGAVVQSLSCGWLGDPAGVDTYKHPWRAQREWAHGFGLARWDHSGHLSLQAIPIHLVKRRGYCVIDGKTITGSPAS